jgi:Coenzyme PQQ synthesis protein D (PqqD)
MGVTVISFADKVSIPSHVIVRFLDKESVLLNLETERYFGLDETGTRMWQATTSGPNIEFAYRQLLDEYDVGPETLRENLAELLEKLTENGLLMLASSDVGTPSAI